MCHSPKPRAVFRGSQEPSVSTGTGMLIWSRANADIALQSRPVHRPLCSQKFPMGTPAQESHDAAVFKRKLAISLNSQKRDISLAFPVFWDLSFFKPWGRCEADTRHQGHIWRQDSISVTSFLPNRNHWKQKLFQLQASEPILPGSGSPYFAVPTFLGTKRARAELYWVKWSLPFLFLK